jgi:hypothetical protein
MSNLEETNIKQFDLEREFTTADFTVKDFTAASPTTKNTSTMKFPVMDNPVDDIVDDIVEKTPVVEPAAVTIKTVISTVVAKRKSKHNRSKQKKELIEYEKGIKEKTNKDLEICKNRFNRSFHLTISEHEFKKDEVKRLQEDIERFEMSLAQTRRLLKKRQSEILGEQDNIGHLKKKEAIIEKERTRRNAIVEKEKYAAICRSNLIENFKVSIEDTDEFTDDEIIKTAQQKTLERLFEWFLPEDSEKYDIWEQKNERIYFSDTCFLPFTYDEVSSYNSGFSIYTTDDDIQES